MKKFLTVVILLIFAFWQSINAQVPFTQLGADINGEAFSDGFGVDAKFSADGQRLVVGGNNNQGGSLTVNRAGHVRVYEWKWKHLGAIGTGHRWGQYHTVWLQCRYFGGWQSNCCGLFFFQFSASI